MIPEERTPLIFEGVSLRRRRWSLPRKGLLLVLAFGAAEDELDDEALSRSLARMTK